MFTLALTAVIKYVAKSLNFCHHKTETQNNSLQTTKLHYVESGTENDRFILLLHGFPDCSFGWRYQIPTLSRYHRVIALDLKGFSDSDKPLMRHNYRPNAICSELKDFLDSLNIKTVTIIGHDLGGLIGWIFALKFPDYVSKFIAIAAPHPNQYWHPSSTALTTRNWFSMVQVKENFISWSLKLSYNFKAFHTFTVNYICDYFSLPNIGSMLFVYTRRCPFCLKMN